MQIFVQPHAEAILSALDHIKLPAFSVDRDFSILRMNATASTIFGYSDRESLGKDIFALLSLGYDTMETVPVSFFPGLREQFRNGNFVPGDSEFFCRVKNGDFFSARISFIPVTTGDNEIIVFHNVSDIRKLRLRASQRTKDLSVFNAFAQIITTADTISVANETIKMLCENLEADAGWLYLYDEQSGQLLLESSSGFPMAVQDSIFRVRPGECFNGKVFSSGRPLISNDVESDPRICNMDTGMQSLSGVPLYSKGAVTGVLGLGSVNKAYFTSMDIQLLTTLGTMLGVAIEKARLIEKLREKMKHIELINEISGIVNSSLSIGTIFRIMVSELRKLISYDRASLLLFDEKKNSLIIFALDTELKTRMKKGAVAPVEGTSAGWVIKNNKPWITEDLEETEFPLDRKLLKEGLRSTVSIPLYRDRMLGVVNFDSVSPLRYTATDLEILLPVTKNISIALENALLFEVISKEKKEWEKTFDAITDFLWIEDSNGRVIRANKTLLTHIAKSSIGVCGMFGHEIMREVGIDSPEDFFSGALSRQKSSFYEVRGSGGALLHFWTYPLLDDEGRLYALVHYVKDVTSRKHLEQQLVRSDRLASLGTLVAGIAHEINNPLGIIAGYSEALIERSRDSSLRSHSAFEDFPEYLETIHSEIFRSKGILSSLLAFARPAAKSLREIDINELIKEVILLVNHKAKRLNHHLELDLTREIPKIQAEPGSLRQLFMNIIINSMYFTPEGGRISILTEVKPLNLQTNIEIRISDTGSGIPPDIIDRIFDPFFTTKPVGEGTGLGLSICHRIAEEHGGDIVADSQPGMGSTFIIRLPLKRSIND